MKKQDFIIIAVVGIVAIALFLGLYVFNVDSGKYVEVEVDGKIVDTFQLDKDTTQEYDFDGEKNTLQIKDGKATMSKANCPDKICVGHKPIYRKGESIICLPHKMVITVTSDEPSDDEIDAVA